MVFNSAMPTTAAPVKQPTGTTIRTMLQLATASGSGIWIEEWGISFDATAAATPVQCELVDTATVAATLNTAHVAANVVPLNAIGDANTQPLTVGTTAQTAFATGATTEGTITATRVGDMAMVPPSSLYCKMFPLGREFFVGGGRFLRVRVTAAATVNCYTYVVFNG
jgi:hypothetical protein